MVQTVAIGLQLLPVSLKPFGSYTSWCDPLQKGFSFYR